MNPQPHPLPAEDDDAGWRALAQSLAGDLQPPSSDDGWPRLSAQLQPQAGARAAPPRRRRRAWLAAAAAAVTLLVASHLVEPPLAPVDPAAEVLLREAQALEREFGGAYRLFAQTPQPEAISAALQELERESQSIHAALALQPGSQRLFDQLRRTHELRLRLLMRGSELAA